MKTLLLSKLNCTKKKGAWDMIEANKTTTKRCVINQQLFSESYLRELYAGKFTHQAVEVCRQIIREWREAYPNLEDENLLCVVVLVKRDGLPWRHRLRHHEEVLCVPVLPIELDAVRPATSWTRPTHEVLAVTLLQNERSRRLETALGPLS